MRLETEHSSLNKNYWHARQPNQLTLLPIEIYEICIFFSENGFPFQN